MSLDFPELSTYRWSCKDESKRFPVENPATGKVITTIQAGDAQTTDEAVKASEIAFQERWRWVTPKDRSAYLLKCGNLLANIVKVSDTLPSRHHLHLHPLLLAGAVTVDKVIKATRSAKSKDPARIATMTTMETTQATEAVVVTAAAETDTYLPNDQDQIPKTKRISDSAAPSEKETRKNSTSGTITPAP